MEHLPVLKIHICTPGLQTLSVGHLKWAQWGIQGNLCVEAESRGTQPELHLGTVALHQDSHNFIIPGSLGGQNTANGLKIFLPHSDQERTDRLGKNKSSQSLVMHTWARQSLDAGVSCFQLSHSHSRFSPTPLASPVFSFLFFSLCLPSTSVLQVLCSPLPFTNLFSKNSSTPVTSITCCCASNLNLSRALSLTD